MSRWQKTHETLAGAALQLFLDQGFAGTGTAQIADLAGVSEMTLFRHFPTKEALLLEDPFDPRIAEAVRTRPPDEPPLRAVTEGIREAWATVAADEVSSLRQRLRLIAETPGLTGALERGSAATVDAIAAALSERNVAAASAKVVAAAVIAGLSAALLDWAVSDSVALGAAIEEALNVLEAK
jgi:AcrR family transcriptional regulator